MLLVAAAVSNIEKRGTAPAEIGGFAFVEASDVKAVIRDQLVRVGVMAHPSINAVDVERVAGSGKSAVVATVRGTLSFVNVDDRKEVVVDDIAGMGLDYGDKAVSKAITSAIKYGLLNAFTIPTGDDPDGSPDQLPAVNGQHPPVHPEYQQRPQQPPPQPQQAAPWSDGSPLPPEPNAPPPQRYGPGQYDQYAAAQQPPPQQPQQPPGGYQHPQQQPANDPAGSCPRHGKPWRAGAHGWYCSSRESDPAFANSKGYCQQTPDPAWIARNER